MPIVGVVWCSSSRGLASSSSLERPIIASLIIFMVSCLLF
jgi:hypothetical protein